MLLITNRSQEVISPPVRSFTTTGSMEEGSPFLTCANATDFAIGDGIIVEIGGEAGGGLINTDGVGGRQAALSPTQSHNYYGRHELPMALVTTIVGKVGNVLELADEAYVATTNANVYYDNKHMWTEEYGNFYFHQNLFENKTIQFPAGRFAFSGNPTFGQPENCSVLGYQRAAITGTRVAITGVTQADPAVVTSTAHPFDDGDFVVIKGLTGGMTQLNGRTFQVDNATADTFELRSIDSRQYEAYSAGGTVAPLILDPTIQSGETRIFSPKGSVSVGMAPASASNLRIARITVEQNWLLDGQNIWYNGAVDGWGQAIQIGGSASPIMHDNYLINHGVSGIQFHNCEGARGFRCRVYREEPHETYMQWGIGPVHCDDTIWYDSRVDCPTGILPAFEPFRSTNSTFVRCGGINAISSLGGSAGFLYDEFWSLITEGAGVLSERNWISQEIIIVADNVGSSLDMSVGGEIRNPWLIQLGPITPEGGLMRAITIYAGDNGPTEYRDILVTGTDYGKALIRAPDMILSGWGGAHIGSTAYGTEISGVRLIGDAGERDNITIFPAVDAVVEDCVVDSIFDDPGITKTNNRTNAEYNA